MSVRCEIVGPLGHGGFDVHREGCRDLNQPKYRGVRTQRGLTPPWVVDAASRKDIVFDIYADVMGDTYLPEEKDDHWQEYDDLQVFPCVGNLPDEVAD